MRRAGILAALSAVLVLLPAGSASASGPTITGAGSTWVQIALDQWRADASRQGLSINYQGSGSTAGRQFFIINQVDFAASEIPFLPDEVNQLRQEHKSYQYLPDVAGGTAVMYNLRDASGHQVNNLRLSPSTVAKIFTGQISNWNDPAIKADNPGLALPNEHLQPVIRSDGSGTSAKLADYLAHEAASIWNPFAAANNLTLPVQFWPNWQGVVAVRGSDGMANYISNSSVGQGSIGYVEAGYVYEHSMVPAFIRNASGNYAAPSSVNVAVALKHATLNRDLTQNLLGVYNAPEANAYPLASYSYLITQTSGFSPAKGAVLGKWIIYIACAGQQEAAPLGYSPLSPNLVKAVFQAVRRIPGAPAPPPLTATACPNPTITGKGYGGSPGPTGTSSGGGTDVPSGSSTTPSSGKTSGKTAKGGSNVTDPAVSAALGQPAGLSVATLTDGQKRAAYVTALDEAKSLRRAAAPSTLVPVVVLLAILLGPLGMAARRRTPGGGIDA
ncbi:MAG TPA: phosphate ABC transporter substrate-binding protein PstS [Gaiellales bacterium]